MTVGERWTPKPLTGNPKEQSEYIALVDGELLPPGVAMARELIRDGADWAYDVENFGGSLLTLRNDVAECVAKLKPPRGGDKRFDRVQSPSLAAFVAIVEPLLRRHDSVSGFPDVLGACGTVVIMREMRCRPDKLKPTQHAFARVAQEMLGEPLDLAEVVWGQTKATVTV